MRWVLPVLGVWLLDAFLPLPAPQAAPPSEVFRDIRAEAGIGFFHHSSQEKKFIHESMGGGVALFDFDNDGLVDIFFTDSPTAGNPQDSRSALYRNLGHGRFEDVTERAGVGHVGWGMGVCTADVDGDGFEDLYVTSIGGNHYFHNNGDGTFTDRTDEAGLRGSGWSAGCGFADYDHDGRLDLFVSRYVKLDLDRLPEFGKGKTCEYRGVKVQCGPRGLPGETDLLFHNEGDGHFKEVSERAGVHDPRGSFGLGVSWFDFNDDGWPDLYVANDTNPSFLYVNQGDGSFREEGFPLGVAVSENGIEQGGMGVAIGDYDNSGRFSIYKTNFAEETSNLWHNDGDQFTDVSYRSKTAPSSLPFVKWGTAFLDYDNDGFLDLVAVTGHVYPQMDEVHLGAQAGYRQRRLLYHNLGNGTFEEVGASQGPVLNEPRVSRGLAVGDLDNDGRLDVVINDLDGHPQVLHNEFQNAGHFLIVKLKGKGTNTSAVGAVTVVKAGRLTMRRLVQSGSSYLSQDDKRLHFGLGKEARADWVEVRWPRGGRSRLEGVPADQILEIQEP